MLTSLLKPDQQIIPVERVPFALLEAGFARACDARPAAFSEFDIGVAGFRLRVEIVGTDLAATMRRAFSHLIVPKAAAEPDLALRVWDEAATGVKVPGQYSPERRRDGDVEILLKISEDGRYVGEQRDLSVSWLDTVSSRIVGCVSSARCQYLDERARPYHKLISAWLDERGIQFVHAGLIGSGDTGVLFVGNGGAGKSTSSVACLRAGLGYLGDDFVGIERNGGAYTGHGLFSSCLLDVHHLERFPDLKRHAVPAHQDFEEKSILYLADMYPGTLRRSVPIAAVMLPRVVRKEQTTYRRASKAQALFAIAPTSVMFLPRPSQRAFDRVADLVERVPAYWLELGSDVDRIPDAVKALAAEVSH
jgi:hypothetical protein